MEDKRLAIWVSELFEQWPQSYECMYTQNNGHKESNKSKITLIGRE